jgi:hypothetical protein
MDVPARRSRVFWVSRGKAAWYTFCAGGEEYAPQDVQLISVESDAAQQDVDREELRQVLADIKSTVAGIRKEVRLERSPEIMELARKAAASSSKRRDEDLLQWAQRLAEDVADADD